LFPSRFYCKVDNSALQSLNSPLTLAIIFSLLPLSLGAQAAHFENRDNSSGLQNNLTAATDDRAGRVSTTEYDALGRAVKVTAPDGTFTTSTYDAAGRMTAATDARGNTTTYTLDNAGRSTAVTNALGQTTSYTYDDAGKQLTMTDALGRTTTTLYDTLGRPTKVTAHDGTFTETFYDTAGRRTAQKDAAGLVTNYEYDSQSRLTAVIDAQSQRTEYRYDSFGRQTQQIDALGRTTAYQYDVQGRRIKRTLPLGMFETVAYDAAGQMQSRTDFNGRATTYTYDTLGRPLTRTPAAAFTAEPATTWTYYPDGKRHTMTDPTGTTTYTYDTRDRLTTKATPQGTLTYTYDSGSNLTGITTTTPNGASMTYSHDALNRIATVTDLNAQTTTYNYDDVGNLAATALPNGVTSQYTYSPLNRLLNLASTKASTTLANYAYTLSATGHRLTALESGPPVPGGSPTTRSLTYTYDTLHRLTSETVGVQPLGASPSGATNWTHDAVSNRLTQTSTLPNIPNQSFSYDQNDRLTTDTYDQNGNTLHGSVGAPPASGGAPTSAPITGTDSYDSHDRLTLRQSPDGSLVQVKYNGEGHRVEHHVLRPAAGPTPASYTITRYLVDDLNPTGYAQVIEESTISSLSGAPNAPPVLSAVYTYGHDLISQDRATPATNLWNLSYYGYDGHGNVRTLTNAAGQITDTYDYDTYGQLLHTTGATTNPYLYTGEQYDPALGLYHLRARMMNPLTGRFWNADTYEGTQDPASLHKYLYANADPVQGIDPSGNFTLSEAVQTVRLYAQNFARSAVNIYKRSAAQKNWAMWRVQLRSGAPWFQHTFIWAENLSKPTLSLGYHILALRRDMAASRRLGITVPGILAVLPQVAPTSIGSLPLPIATIAPVGILSNLQFALWNFGSVGSYVFREFGSALVADFPYNIPDCNCITWTNQAAALALALSAIPL
jgi:RHS repeat-associated protein